ncbi:MAG: LLM class flavin-dependent oxidoreductase [Solirubrobacterales bacterium]|nr:LLM class flavin-dependent oxidoreductase [Solirubrobacterales bacterium]
MELAGSAPTRRCARTLDPFIALTDAAAGSSRIRLGTGICQLAQRDPIICANEVASLDRLSGGRLEFAVGGRADRL